MNWVADRWNVLAEKLKALPKVPNILKTSSSSTESFDNYEQTRRAWLGMRRVQVAGLLVVQIAMIAIVMFYLLGLNMTFSVFLSSSFYLSSSVWCTVAALIGLLIFHQLAQFPNPNTLAYLMLSTAVSYSSMALLIFALRGEYSRPLVIASFIGAIAWNMVLHFAYLRDLQPKISVVPGGNLRGIGQFSSVKTVFLITPADHQSSAGVVVADLHHDHERIWDHYLAKCVLAGIPVYDVKNLIETLSGRVEIEHLSENNFGAVLPSNLYLKVKRTVDFIFSLVILLPILVVVFLTIIIIRLESPGPAIFKQDRMGYRGKVFTIYKLRSMRMMVQGKLFTEENDPRITRFGAIIRKFRIDELPQIFNILKGDMSWIGPRPEVVGLADWYATEIPFYIYRHAVRPGITGWAQVNQGNVAEIDAATLKLQYDFYYIKHFSPWLDALLVLQTFRIVLAGFGSR